MPTDLARLRRTPGVRFAKLLGTGSGRTFTARDADLTQWALLVAHDPPAVPSGPVPLAERWQAAATECWTARLRPLASRGRWSRREPFGEPAHERHDGPVAALTRARLRPGKAVRFWRAVPPVSAALRDTPGLLLAVGVGEAPIGLQGTFSLWSSPAALRAFAYANGAHAEAVSRTPVERWYAEELFARFAVESATGTVGGRDPLGGPEGGVPPTLEQ